METKMIRAAIAAICVVAALPSWADTNITSNVTLTEDTDWSDLGKVTIAAGVTVDLNGHTLKVKGLECNGTITDGPLPEYLRLSYIQSSGTQYINTQFVTTDRTAIDFDFTTLSDNGNHAYFCGDWATSGHLFVANSDANNTFRFFGTSSVSMGSFRSNTHFRLMTFPDGNANGKTVVMYDGESGAEIATADIGLTHNNTGKMTLFATSSGQYAAKYKLHRFTLTHEGTVVRDLVPVKRTSDGEVGLYDLANSTFYGNDGSGTFVEGEVVVGEAPVSDGCLAIDVSDGAAYSVAGLCNVSVDVVDSVLDDDCDLRCFGRNLKVSGTVYLKGHALKVNGLACDGAIVPEYQQLSYIQSSGTQYINTQFVTTDRTAIDFDFTTLSDNGNHAYFCGDWATSGHLFVANSDANNTFRFFGTSSVSMGSFRSNTHFRLMTFPDGNANGKTVVMYDGESGAEIATADIGLTHNNTGKMTLFATSSGQYAAKYKLHRFTLTHEGTVVRDLVPVKRTSDGEVGLYDLANSTFYGNDGSGAFVEGDPVFCGVLVPGGSLFIDVSGGAAYSVAGSCGAPVIVENSVLADDCDLRCFGRNVSVTGTVHLLGHKLTVAETAGSGVVSAAALPIGGELRIDVAAGTSVVNSELAIAGGARVVKSGAGVFVADKAGQSYNGGTVLEAGYLKPGKNSAGVFGATGSSLAVEDGAQYLDDIWAPNALVNHNLFIAGEGPDGYGALRTTLSGKNNNASYGWMKSLTLMADALIHRDAYAFSLMAVSYGALPVALNGHVLTVKSAVAGNNSAQNYAYLLTANLSDSSGGTIAVGDNIQFFPYQNASALDNTTLVVETNAIYYSSAAAKSMTVSNFVYHSSSSLSYTQTTTVLGCYAPVSTASAPKVVLGDATHLSPTLDLSTRSGTFDADFGGGLTFAEGTTVSVKIGDRKVPTKVIGWAEGTGPANVRFVLADAVGKLRVESDGVYRRNGFVIIVK